MSSDLRFSHKGYFSSFIWLIMRYFKLKPRATKRKTLGTLHLSSIREFILPPLRFLHTPWHCCSEELATQPAHENPNYFYCLYYKLIIPVSILIHSHPLLFYHLFARWICMNEWIKWLFFPCLFFFSSESVGIVLSSW